MEFAKDKVEWLEYDIFSPYSQIKQATFLRHGGVSPSPFASLNVGKDVGDNPDHVKVNRERVRDIIDFPSIVYAKQTHSLDVAEVTPQNIDHIPPADALFTNMPNVALAITHADCQAILVYDPFKEVIAAIHAGWKGSVGNIIRPLIDAMKKSHQSDPKDFLVSISPSLGPDHAEYKEYKKDFPEELWSFQKTDNHFDFWAISIKQLTECGVQQENIECAEICTFCDKENYFSHRRSKKTGRNVTFIGIEG